MANGHAQDGPMGQWTRLLLQIGVPAAIALYLVYSLNNKIVGTLDEMAQSMKMHAQTTQQVLQQMQDTDGEQLRREQQMIDVLRQQCINNAEGPKQRESCFYPEPSPR
jgi:hypothetical protein